MSDYLPIESASIVIGVCGEQAAGKTVFQTCIFQSIRKYIPPELLLEFDRKEIGNASYFQAVENRLISDGTTVGTTDKTVYPVRLFLRAHKPRPAGPSTVLSVDLVDFAGGHFTSVADLKHLKPSEGTDTEDVAALRTVNETLERADAFVVLINAKEIDPINDSPSRNPFSPSVEFILTHCRAEGKPVALLFSQADQTPLLTEETFHALPRVHDFERDFTADLREAERGNRPFGVARRISCYETVDGDVLPRHQTGDGSIWRREAADVVLTLIRATIPRINAQIEAAAAHARAQKERAEREASERRRRWRTIGVAALLMLVSVVALSAWMRYQQSERQDVDFLRSVEARLRGGKLTEISADQHTRLGRILDSSRTRGASAPTAIRDAVRDLHSAAEEATQRLAGSPLLDRGYSGEISRLQSLMPLLDPASLVTARQQWLPLLEARNNFLSQWFGTERNERRLRTTLLDQSARQFHSTGDQAFSGLLAAQSSQEKQAEIATWQQRIDADADVPTRLVTMQNLLSSSISENDPEYAQLARKALAFALPSTILKRHENTFLREKLLTPLAADLAQFSDGEVRFEVLARNLLACATREECVRRQQIVESVNSEGGTFASSWSSGVDNLLRSLLLDLPVEQRDEVWSTLAASLQTSYLFSSRSDAWPQDIMPLHAWIRSRLDGTDDPTIELIDRISKQPIYGSELHYLQDHLAATEAQRRVVAIYTNLLSALAQRMTPLPTDDLMSVNQQLSSIAAERNDVGEPLRRIANEIGQVLTLVRAVNDSSAISRLRNPLMPPPGAARLQHLLHDARKGHCTALITQEPPAECANAA